MAYSCNEVKVMQLLVLTTEDVKFVLCICHLCKGALTACILICYSYNYFQLWKTL